MSKLNGSNFSFYKTLFFPENQMWELLLLSIFLSIFLITDPYRNKWYHVLETNPGFRNKILRHSVLNNTLRSFKEKLSGDLSSRRNRNCFYNH
ncbi:hypothetical protein E4412_11095 [Leptospira interrogans]|nr:hypothetical protein E4412_11095 [Leptospira interrogans]